MIEILQQPVRGADARENWRIFRVATWLGWQVEGNWTDPFAFFIFTVLRPLATALMIVVMYQVIAGGARTAFFSYLYISNAFFVLVVQAMAGMAWAVLDDRENYKMLKYIYTAPGHKFAYLLGRSVAKVVIGLLSTLILLAVGTAFLGLDVRIDRVAWGALALDFALGIVILGGLGIVLGGVALVIARNSEMIGEVTAGMLLVFSGAYFPPDILPPGLQQLTLVLPITYWLEAMRRAVNGGILLTTALGPDGAAVTGPVSPLLARFDDGQLLAILVGSALVCGLGSYLFYNWVEHQARERGMIDKTTEH